MSEMAVIVPYFNFMNYETPKSNFRKSCNQLIDQSADLFIGEVALENQDFLLKSSPKVFQYKTDSVLWYKENIINIIIRNLPNQYKYISWIDADCLFSDNNWIEHTINILQKFSVAQLFQKCVRLDRHKLPHYVHSSVPFWLEEKEVDDEVASSIPGGAWAARREFIEKHGLLDSHIIGGSDSFAVFAYYGWWNDYHVRLCDKKIIEYFRKWADPVHQDILGRVGYVNGHADFLWHGSVKNRMYASRQSILNLCNYNPYKDLSYDKDGLLHWGSDNILLHELVRRYLIGRKEDEL